MGRIYAGTLGLLAFVTIIARGLIHGAAPGNTMLYAAAAMFLFAAIGWVAGTIAGTNIAETVQRQFDAEVEAEKTETQA